MIDNVLARMRRVVAGAVLAAVTMGVGCVKEQAAKTPAVRIAPTIVTRVNGLFFENGDKIGLTIKHSAGTYVDNTPMTYNGTNFTAAGLIWYNDLNTSSTLTAYYPYSTEGIADGFDVDTNQSAGVEGSDLLGAVVNNARPTTAAVPMTFHHLMAQIAIAVTNSSEADIESIEINGSIPSAVVDMENLSATAASAATATITAYEMVKNSDYRVIVVPQRAALSVTVRTTDGKSRTEQLLEAEFKSGFSYTMNLAVSNIDIALTLSGEIKDWESGGELVNSGAANSGGDDTTGSGGNDSTTGTITHDGETYATATIGGKVWMAENLRNLPAGATIGTDVWYPGVEADAASKGLLYSYAVATNGESTEPMQGICPEGWHLPSQSELEALVSATLPDGFLTPAGFYVATTSRYMTTKNYLMSSTPSDSNCQCAVYTDTAVTEVTAMPNTNGYSVRCVRD